jgi:hypothetical protein
MPLITKGSAGTGPTEHIKQDNRTNNVRQQTPTQVWLLKLFPIQARGTAINMQAGK